MTTSKKGVFTIASYKRFEGETDDELILRIGNEKDNIGTWQDVADILNKLLNVCHSESKYRKQVNAFNKTHETSKDTIDDTTNELMQQKRELERLKIQYRDERNAWQKQNYTAARVEQKLDYLEEKLKEIGKIKFTPVNVNKYNSDNDLLIQISDWHIGQEFSSILGEYNTDIAKQRVQQLLIEVLKIRKRHNSQNAIVLLQGDLIAGSIHKSIQLTNRENVIDQIKIASELIASFCHELCKYFNKVHMYDVVGNHGRIDKKEDALHDERLDSLISWSVSNILSDVENFRWMKHRSLDVGIVDMNIRGKTYFAVHGDYDNFSRSGVSQLSAIMCCHPEGVFFAHYHHSSIDEENGIRMIRGGCLCGTGDQYTLEKRIVGKASQMVTVCDEHGIVCHYPIILD